MKKSTINITINLIVQLYDPEDDFIHIDYFAVPLSLKGSDMIKMIDIKLKEQLRYSFESITDTPEPDLTEFAKQCRIVYVLRNETRSRGITVFFEFFLRIVFKTPVKSINLFLYNS